MKNLFFIFSIVLYLQTEFLTAKMYDLAICTIFKNEAPYLEEWIEYHKLVGVEHFYLYNNESEDNFLNVLKPFIELGEVTLIHWPDRSSNEYTDTLYAWVYSTQMSACEDAISLAKNKTKWIAAIDVDEFIVPVQENSIPAVLSKYEKQFPGVAVFWDLFGTSNLDLIPPNKLLIEVLHKKAPENCPLHLISKTILKPEMYKNFEHPPHTCNYINGKSHHPIPKTELVINHYTNRCNAYFYVNKIKNKKKMDNTKLSQNEITSMLDFGNEEEDPTRSIQRFVPSLRKKIQLLQ